ncbi:ATP-binding protein [Bacillus dakarensis]|uniref:ATP-binding protein n=1 Tax=Robertmurraya dakarensis TaxID=1926278 RepID=UPI000981B75E|nr:AAA family ATPase [Bacillus dakarensis]
MKIEEIHIYGYGKLENVVIRELGDSSVFYGHNEAGKSTIMSFIHSILFGFPTKQQSELRYEPKKGGKYGGQLIVSFEDRGRAIIERIKGRAVGDVSVRLEDGTGGGEELLKELLFSIDKTLFQSIFSFNLHGLQNVHHLKSEDLGKFLFSTGAIGSDRLLMVEQQLQKELEMRFKPNGKKPYLNEKLIELKDAYAELKKAEQQNEQYNTLIENKGSLAANIMEKRKRESFLKNRLQKVEEWKTAYLIVKEREMLEEELNGLVEGSFPVDGISRLEQLIGLIKPLEGQLEGLEEKLEILKNEYKELPVNYELIKREVEINQTLEKMALFDILVEEKNEWRNKAAKIKSEIDEIKERLHLSLEDEHVLNTNISLVMKEKTAEAQQKQQQLKVKKSELDQKFLEEKESLERIELQIKQLQSELLQPKERSLKKQQLENSKNKGMVEKELINVQDKLRILDSTKQSEKERAKQFRLQMNVFTLLFLVLFGWAIWNSQYILAVLILIGVTVTFILFSQKSKKSVSAELGEEILKLKEQERKLQSVQTTISPMEVELLEEQLLKDDELQKRYGVLKIKWEQQNGQYERVLEAYENWERSVKEHNQLLKDIGNELSLPEDVAMHFVHDAFLLLVQLKEKLRDYQYQLSQIEKKNEAINEIKDRIMQLNHEFLHNQSLSIQETAVILKSKLKAEIESSLKKVDLEARMKDSKAILEEVRKERNYLHKEMQTLFQLAGVSTEEEFRSAGKLEEKRLNLLKRVEELTKRIKLTRLTEDEIDAFLEITDVDAEIHMLKERIDDIIQSIQEDQQALAEVKHRIDVLESGGIYTDLLHQYKAMQSEFEQEAKVWAKIEMAKEMLRKTVDVFKYERLPQLLVKAEEYLSYLTEGNYCRIIPKEDSNGFVIERKDYTRFDANELSQATTEQVYVALRLALATTIYKKYSFPIIIDDSFVNFDHNRTQRVIKLLRNLEGNQVLFFTCHQHLLKHFDKNQIIFMNEQFPPVVI